MIEHRPLATLDGGDHGWLQARHHFAFAGVGKPEHAPIRALKVWNDDTVAPHSGFPLHPHRNIEIVTFVREGAITHEDSLGNKGHTLAGDVQVMSAGTGIAHAEYNAEEMTTRLFQIWLAARTPGGAPRWANRAFPRADRGGRFVTLASGTARDGALPIDADADVLGASLQAGDILVHDLAAYPDAYLVPTAGRILLNGIELMPGDGAAIHHENQLTITAIEDTQVVLVALT